MGREFGYWERRHGDWVLILLKRHAMERKLRRRGFGFISESGGIVRNDIFPDTLPYKYPYFSPFVLQMS